jgi:hypothetical protein
MMDRQTMVSGWEEYEVSVECVHPCELKRLHRTAADAISVARKHVLETGHSVDVRQVRHLVVRAVEASGGFEACGVPEEPNLRDQCVWEPAS